MDRQDFMDIVYSELHSDGDNNRANKIIEAADEYAESAQLSTNLAEVGTNLNSRQALLDKFEPWLKVKDYNDGELNMLKAILYEIRFMWSAQPEIIRCKDCKHLFNKDNEGGKCWHFNGFSKVVSYDDFCSRAERRTAERFD